MENSGFKIVCLVICILVLFQACTSDEDTYISLSEDEVCLLRIGDTLVYADDEGKLDSLFVHESYVDTSFN